MWLSGYDRVPAGDLDALYEEYKDVSSPSKLPPEVLAAMSRLLDEDAARRARENGQLLLIVISALAIIVGASLTGASAGLSREGTLDKRDSTDDCGGFSRAAVLVTTIVNSQTQEQSTQPLRCPEPTLLPDRAGQSCVVNSAAMYVSCGDSSNGIAVCNPGFSLIEGTSQAFAAACSGGMICSWPCGAGYIAQPPSDCVPAPTTTPPPSTTPTASVPEITSMATTSSSLGSTLLSTSSSSSSSTLPPGACTADRDCLQTTTTRPLALPTCTKSTCGFVCAAPQSTGVGDIVYSCTTIGSSIRETSFCPSGMIFGPSSDTCLASSKALNGTTAMTDSTAMPTPSG